MVTQNRGGCIGGAIISVLVGLMGLVFTAGIAWLIFSAFQSSSAYQIALQRAQASAEVQEALGTPVEADFWVMGSLEQSGPMEDAQLTIPLHGPRGRGTLYVNARGAGDEITFFVLQVEVNGQTINLK